jgi:hypothetical protein
VASYGKESKAPKGGKDDKSSGSKGNDQPVLYPTTHRPKGKGKGGQSL